MYKCLASCRLLPYSGGLRAMGFLRNAEEGCDTIMDKGDDLQVVVNSKGYVFLENPGRNV
jgi:hypothetical protein